MAVSWRRWAGERHRSEASPSVQTEAMSSLWVRLVLPEYNQASLPAVAGSDDTWWTSWTRQRWVQVLAASHPYLRVLRTLSRWWRGDGSDRTAIPVGGSDWTAIPIGGSDRTAIPIGGSDRTAALADEGRSAMLDVVHALTALTVTCFALALLYDFQYPEDDGFCAAQMTQATCESRKMLLDPFESQCLWRPPHVSTGSSGSSAIANAAAVVRQIVGGRVVETVPIGSTAVNEMKSCRFNGSNNSSLAFIISYVITSAFAGMLGLLLDRCQEVLKAKEAVVTLQHRRRVAVDDTGDVTTAPVDTKKRSAVLEQLVVREYSEAAVRRQRDRHHCSSLGERSKLPNGRPRRRHAVMDVAMVDEDPMTTRQATRPSTVTMGHDPEVGDHATVSVTAQAVVQVKRSMASTDYAVTMLRLAVADEVGRLGGPAKRHVCLLGLYRAFPAVVTLRRRWLWQFAVVGVLMACNGGALYYIVSKAAVRGLGWQVSFLRIALFEWFSEVVLLRSVEIALFDYGLCWLVGDEVEAAVRQLEAVASEVAAGPSTVTEDGGLAEEEEDAVSGVAGDGAANGRVYRRVGGWRVCGRVGRYRTGLCQWRRVASVAVIVARWWTQLLSRGPLEKVEMAVSFGSPLVLAWLVFMYYRFVDNWLTSLSALGQALAAMTVVLSVLLIGAAATCWVRSRAHLATATLANADGVVSFDKHKPVSEKQREDHHLPVDMDETSWVLSSSSSSSPSSPSSHSLKGSSIGSWQLSHSHSIETHHEQMIEDVSIVIDDLIKNQGRYR